MRIAHLLAAIAMILPAAAHAQDMSGMSVHQHPPQPAPQATPTPTPTPAPA
jgi:hypothetical protein